MSDPIIDKLKASLTKIPTQPIEDSELKEAPIPLIKEVDPELEKLLAEEEAIEAAHTQSTSVISGGTILMAPPLSTDSMIVPDDFYYPPVANQDNTVEVGIPEELLLEEVVAVEVPEYKLNITNDSEHPLLRKAIIAEDLSVSIYLPEGISVSAVSHEKINEFLANEIYEFQAFQVVKVKIDPEQLRTCKWYTPARELVEDLGAEVADGYQFDRAHKVGTCSNPQMIKDSGSAAPICPFMAQGQPFTKCNIYEPELLVVERAVHDQDNDVTLKLTRTRRHFGLREYQIEAADGEGNSKHILSEPITVNNTTTDWQLTVDEAWAKAVQEILGSGEHITDITHQFTAEEEEKDRYINHVLELNQS